MKSGYGHAVHSIEWVDGATTQWCNDDDTMVQQCDDDGAMTRYRWRNTASLYNLSTVVPSRHCNIASSFHRLKLDGTVGNYVALSGFHKIKISNRENNKQ